VTNGTIEDTSRTKRDLVAVLFLLVGATLLIGGVAALAGWPGISVLFGLVLTGLGVSMGLSRTGKE
jgi:hypothetical protein